MALSTWTAVLILMLVFGSLLGLVAWLVCGVLTVQRELTSAVRELVELKPALSLVVDCPKPFF
jgi:hypothetical protein